MSKKYNILILPAGSGMTIAAIKSLKKDPEVNLITVDCDKLAPGLYLADKSYLVPRFEDKDFWPKIKQLIKKEKINFIFPALDTLLLPFAQKRREFKELGAEVMISEPETILITRDKWKTYLKLKDLAPLPFSFINHYSNFSFPVLIKPREGSGSKDVYIVRDKEEFEFYFKRVKNPIVQEYLPGQEWSVDCLTNKKGKLLMIIPRLRIETKSGISVKGKIIKKKELEQMAEKITQAIKFRGIFFFQAKEDKNGSPKLTEINPRIAGTMSLSGASSDIYSLVIRSLSGEEIKIPKIKNNLYITRYWEEMYLSEENFKIISVA